MYENALGVEEDYEMALYWYALAAKQKYAMAINNIGNCFMYGKGEQKNYQAAFSYYMQAAKQNLPIAQYNVGVCYFNGFGVNKDIALAEKYLRLAADGGNRDAIVALQTIFKK